VVQLVKEVSVLYSSTGLGGVRHVWDMLTQAEFTWINFPGNQQNTSTACCITWGCACLVCSSTAPGHGCRALGFDALQVLSREITHFDLTISSTHQRNCCVLAGSTWDQEAIAMAEDALQARYGFTTADQKHRALQQALEHLTNLKNLYEGLKA